MLDGIRHTAIVFPFQYKDVNSNIDYMTSASQKKTSRLRWVISPTMFLLEVSLVSRRLCNTNHISLYYLRQKEMLCLFVISDPSIWHEMIYFFILASTIKTLFGVLFPGPSFSKLTTDAECGMVLIIERKLSYPFFLRNSEKTPEKWL